MSGTLQTLTENRLLAALPRDEYERLAPHLEEISLALSQISSDGDEIASAYLPTNSIVSLLTICGRQRMEVGSYREGLVGLRDWAARTSRHRAGEGNAFKIRVDALRESSGAAALAKRTLR